MEIKRAIHVDFHTMPNIYNFGEEYDAETFAARLKTANVEYVNLVASCNLGFCYFPTKIGVPYPYMKGDRFGETFAACHQKGIGVSAYINVGLNHENAYLHPDWCRVNEHGEKIYGDRTGNFFRRMCYNAEGFRSYILALVEEVLDNYDVDGFFFDGLKIEPCYCEKCLSEMTARSINVGEKDDVKTFAHEKMISLCKELKSLLGDKKVFFCGLPWVDGLSEHIEVECLPSGEWGYDYFHQAAAYARNFTDTPVYMTGRFQADWGDFGGIKTQAAFEYDLFDALSNGCRISFGDHLHPAKNLDPFLYERIGIVYRKCLRYEEYTDGGKYLAEIGVLNEGDIFALDEKRYVGVARMLNELKYSYNLITAASDFERYALLILPDGYLLDEKIAAKISAYLSRGGRVLSAGCAALDEQREGFALDEYAFAQYCGLDENNYPYFRFVGGTDTTWAEYSSAILMKNRNGETIANYIQPYNRRYYDGRHGYFYTPPEQETEYVSAVAGEHAAHISFNVFTAYATHFLSAHRELVGRLLEKLLPAPLIKAGTLPVSVKVTLTETEEWTSVHIRTSYPEIKNGKGVIEEHVCLPVGKTVFVRGRYAFTMDTDTGKRLKTSFENGYTKIVLPSIEGYKLLALKR